MTPAILSGFVDIATKNKPSSIVNDVLMRIQNDIEEMELGGYEREETFRAAVIAYVEDLRVEYNGNR